MSSITFDNTPRLTQEVAIRIARRRIKLMKQADKALRDRNDGEAARLDREAARSEDALIAGGFGHFV